MHAVPASLKDRYVIRFTVTSPRTTVEDVERDWSIIQTIANDSAPKGKERVKLKGTLSNCFSNNATERNVLDKLIFLTNIPCRHQGTKQAFRNEPASRKYRAKHSHDAKVYQQQSRSSPGECANRAGHTNEAETHVK